MWKVAHKRKESFCLHTHPRLLPKKKSKGVIGHWIVCVCVCTWMRLAAGFLLFSKCFCRCCSCTFRAKPDPRIPCRQKHWVIKSPSKTWTLALRHCVDIKAVWDIFDLQLAGRRRRSPAEQNRPIITVRSTSAGSCHRSRWSWGWSEEINDQESELCLTSGPRSLILYPTLLTRSLWQWTTTVTTR